MTSAITNNFTVKMRVKVPEMRKCCFCIPLRPGIILCGYINIVFSLFALACLVVTVELKKKTVTDDASVTEETVTPTVLFCILGMSVLLNAMLLVAGFQKDIPMLRLYNYFALATTFAMLVPALILLFRQQFIECWAAFVAIVLQCYVIVLVRSEVIRLEIKLYPRQTCADCNEEAIVVPDTETLM